VDAEIGRHFAAVIDLARQKLDQVEIVQEDISPARAILELQGRLGNYDIRTKEIFSAEGKLYSYYVLREGQVVLGFDNYPDRRVLREKFGRQFAAHLHERVPHRHDQGKSSVEVTEECDVRTFLETIGAMLT
jgi:hypothetical protein